MRYTKQDAEAMLQKTNNDIARVETMKTMLFLSGDFEKIMDLLDIRVRLEGLKAQLEFLLKENLVD